MTANAEGRSRRAVLSAAFGALAATVAHAVGRPQPARAEGEFMRVGGDHFTATSATQLKNTETDNDVFIANSTAGGKGVWGKSAKDVGVLGQSGSYVGVQAISISNTALDAESQTGLAIRATSESATAINARSQASDRYSGVHATGHTGVYAEGLRYGVHARSYDSDGILGEGAGIGVRGTGSTGLSGSGTVGLDITGGRVQFRDVSGVATIPAGATSVTVVPGVTVSDASFVLLTPRVNLAGRDLWFVTSPASNSFSIRINTSRMGATPISWLLLG